jgi:energy-converting hydrogenase Eha subunit A
MRKALSFVLAAIPFAFALIRAIKTGTDFRYLWMAVASFIAAAVFGVIEKERGRRRDVTTSMPLGVFVIVAVVAALTGYLLGARSSVGVWMVSVGFAFCWALSYMVYPFSRPRPL